MSCDFVISASHHRLRPEAGRYVGRNQPVASCTGGGIATTVYDAVGNRVNAIDPLSHKTTYVYDSINRLTKTTDALGGVTTMVYDAACNEVNLIDSVGNKTTFVYDSLNRLIEEKDPLAHSASRACARPVWPG